MNLVVRRRFAVGAVTAATAVVAGLLVAPAVTAATNGLVISPSAVLNTETTTLTFQSTDAEQRYGADATFTRLGAPATFTVAISFDRDPQNNPPSKERTNTALVNFTDYQDGLGKDGPADAGVYAVSLTGKTITQQADLTDTC